MKKIKIIFFVLLVNLILSSCGTVKEAFEAPRKNSSDEFLIEKKSPLSMPPDFEKLPEPKSKKESKKFEEKSNLEELILKSENNELSPNEFHNDKGPITVSNKKINLDMLEEFQNAAEETGIPRTEDFNTGDNFGIGYFQFTTSRNKLLKLRCSAAKGYLNPVKNRSNLNSNSD